jgi:ATP-binding cassette subfamily A (ABC1) protein 3
LLAVLAEKYLHGNNHKRRGYSTTAEAASSHAAIETVGLEKYYLPSIWERMFCCCRTRRAIKAVDGLNLVSEKRQILCLLGPNGSGKTTTLDMIAGFHAPTSGSININAAPSELGICPQKNVLWDNLTVAEHLDLWNALKGAVVEDPAALGRLMEKCDLTLKKASLARNLSGGMKRKLQLACMLVGGSSVCLLDEVTSGLDPISRRVIWNAVLSERSRRTMIFTTHFLDECEVLSDHIVIVSQGKLKCQGTPSDLKNQYGGGYRVHAPESIVAMTNISYPVTNRGDDKVVISTPDSSSAAEVFEKLKMFKDDDIYITGPTVEDVFLNVSAEEHVLASNDDSTHSSTTLSNPDSAKRAKAAQPRMAFFLGQLRALFIKRLIILRSQWWVYLLALAIPIGASAAIASFLHKFIPPSCGDLIKEDGYLSRISFSASRTGSVIGPVSANSSITEAIGKVGYYPQQWYTNPNNWSPTIRDTRESFLRYISDNPQNVSSGGLFLGNTTAPIIAIPALGGGVSAAMALVNIASMVRSGTTIFAYSGYLKAYNSYSNGSGLMWITVSCDETIFSSTELVSSVLTVTLSSRSSASRNVSIQPSSHCTQPTSDDRRCERCSTPTAFGVCPCGSRICSSTSCL